jgi:hypothetical protein
MTNNKAREVNNPLIKQLLDETTAEELAKIDAEMTNNKQQTAVKLYTEEQVRKAIELSRDTHPQGMGYVVKDVYDYSMDEVVDLLTHIELPSDEEIEKKAPYSTLGWGYEFGMNDGFKKGAKFVIDKIQGGNNEQQ